jgi:hypothetical protein
MNMKRLVLSAMLSAFIVPMYGSPAYASDGCIPDMMLAQMIMGFRQYREHWSASDIKQVVIDNGVSGDMLAYQFAMIDNAYGVPVKATDAEKDAAVREFAKMIEEICVVSEAMSEGLPDSP